MVADQQLVVLYTLEIGRVQRREHLPENEHLNRFHYKGEKQSVLR